MMQAFSLRRRVQRVTRFIFVQFCVLAGWIAVQLVFSLSPFGQTFAPFTVMVAESIWWMALLLVLLLLFLREHHRFVRAVLDLEEVNLKLRRRTRGLLDQLRLEHFPEEFEEANHREARRSEM